MPMSMFLSEVAILWLADNGYVVCEDEHYTTVINAVYPGGMAGFIKAVGV